MPTIAKEIGRLESSEAFLEALCKTKIKSIKTVESVCVLIFEDDSKLAVKSPFESTAKPYTWSN